MTLPHHRPRRLPSSRIGGVGLALISLLVASVTLAPGPVRADGSSSVERAVPGDQPLPGYTIDNPELEPLVIGGRETRVHQGVRKHAAYDIEVPARWNGELVMWAHGYRGTGKTLTVDAPAYDLRELFLRQGYAWAASSYARNDYDVATGVTTTQDLARYAGQRLGRTPKRTYLAGVSMGGHVIGRSLEQYPGFYDGALPMCGVLGDNRLFDYFLSYNLLAQDLADVPANPASADYLTDDVPRIQQRLGLDGLAPGGPDTTNALGAQLRDLTTELTGGPRPGSEQAFAYWKDFPFTLFTPDTGGSLAANAGRLAQNVDTRYRPNAPVDVNASVERVEARDDASRRSTRLSQIPRILGRPDVPVLSLHGLGDLFVPFSMEQIYAREVARRGQSRNLVQRAVREVGHCEFTPVEARRAWNDLTRWVESTDRGRGHGHGPGQGHHGKGHDKGHDKGHGHSKGVKRPAGDPILDRRAVASPDFGCRFTDPAGYDSPELFPTRALYPRCED